MAMPLQIEFSLSERTELEQLRDKGGCTRLTACGRQ